MFKYVFCFGLLASVLAESIIPLGSNIVLQTTLEDVPIPYAYHGQAVKRFASEPIESYYNDGYQAILVPASPATEVGFSAVGLVKTIAVHAFSIAKKVVLFIIADIPALLIGTLMVFGLCKLTPICTKLSHFKSLVEVQQEVKSLATPERLARASDFVQKAVKKFRALQEDFVDNSLDQSN